MRYRAGMKDWETRLEAVLLESISEGSSGGTFGGGGDVAHDLGHVRRVRANALRLSDGTDAQLEVVLPAVWLHDGVAVSKDSPERSRTSRMAGAWARGVLKEVDYPAAHHDAIVHAIEAHSFSAGIEPTTLEAKIVQDADRLDALGAIGIARCFAVGGVLGREFYAAEDTFCEGRRPDDGTYTVDHFYAKLLGLPATMQTVPGKVEAQRRAGVMRAFLDELKREIGGADGG